MLGTINATATVAVRDLDAARAFYEGKLGLSRAGKSRRGTLLYKTGSTTLLVYISSFAGSNQATAVTWMIPDGLDALVERLAAAGVVFEHYEMTGTNLVGDVHVGHGMKIAWFKDPDGNIHGLAEG